MPGAILREGRMLYRRQEDSDRPADPQARAKDAKQWLSKTMEDLGSAEVLLTASPARVAPALCHCQQAAEKALKAFLIKSANRW